MSKYGLSSKHGREIIVVLIIFAVIATASLVFCLWSKSIKKVPFQSEDAFIVAAVAVMFPFLGLEIASVTNGGVGYHAITKVPPSDLQYSLKLLLALEVHYALLIALVKPSLLLFYRRISSLHRALRLVLALLAAAVWLWSLSAVLSAFLLCAPLPFNWGEGAGSCGNRVASFVANGAANTLTDAAILVLPLPYVWSLQMSVARRVGVAAWFCLGGFVSAISVVRMVALVWLDLEDYTYNVPESLLWSLLECELAIVVADCPSVRPVLVPCCGRLASTVTGGRSGSGGGGGGGGSGAGLSGEVDGFGFERLGDRRGGVEEGMGRGRRRSDGMEAYGLSELDRDGKNGTVLGGRELRDSDSVDNQVKIAERGAMPGRLY